MVQFAYSKKPGKTSCKLTLFPPTVSESKPLLGYKVAQVGTAPEGFDRTVMFRLHHSAMDIIEPVLFKTETVAAAEKYVLTFS